MRPARSGGILSRSRCTSGSVPVRLAVALPARRTPRAAAPPPAMTNSVSEKPNGSTGESLGCDPAPGARLQHAEHDQAQPGRGEHACRRTSSLRLAARCGRRRARSGVIARMNDDEHDLADEHDAPGELGRGPAAEDRADGDAGAGDAADHGVGDLALGALEVAGDQRGQRRQHQRGADALEDRPAERERRRRSAPRRSCAEPQP